MKIHPGQITALVGASGCGSKSSLTSMVCSSLSREYHHTIAATSLRHRSRSSSFRWSRNQKVERRLAPITHQCGQPRTSPLRRFHRRKHPSGQTECNGRGSGHGRQDGPSPRCSSLSSASSFFLSLSIRITSLCPPNGSAVVRSNEVIHEHAATYCDLDVHLLVALARSLISNPKILLLDEATSALGKSIDRISTAVCSSLSRQCQ